METKTQKQKLNALKTEIVAVYFEGQKRILTSVGVNYLDATKQLVDFQKRDGRAITMIVLKELPLDEVSYDLKDYQVYLDKERIEKIESMEHGKIMFHDELVNLRKRVWDEEARRTKIKNLKEKFREINREYRGPAYARIMNSGEYKEMEAELKRMEERK